MTASLGRSFYFDVDKVYADTVTPADTTPPMVTVNAPPVHTWSYNSMPSISGTSGDAGGVAEVRCRLMRFAIPGAPWRNWWTGTGWLDEPVELPAVTTNNWTNWTFTLPSLPEDDRYAFFVIARDNAGNLSPMQTGFINGSGGTQHFRNDNEFYFELDRQAPTVSIAQPTSGGVYGSLAQATGTVFDRVGLPPDGVKVRLQRSSDGLFWNGSSWAGGPVDLTAAGTFVPNTSSPWSYTLPSLAVGSYTFSTQARDWRGNLSAWTSRAFSISGAPVVTIDTPVYNGAYWPSQLPAARGRATGTVDRMHYQLQRGSDGLWWNGSGWAAEHIFIVSNSQPGPLNWEWALPQPWQLQSSNYYFNTWAIDTLGRVSNVASHYFTINNTTGLTMSRPVHGGVYWPSQIPSALVTLTGDIVRMNYQLQRAGDGYFWNGSAWTATGYTFVDNTASIGTVERSWAFPHPSLLQSGGYWFLAQPVDTAGRAPLLHHYFTINNTTSLTVSRPVHGGTYTANQILSATGTISGDIWRMNYQLQRSDNGWCWNSTTGAWEPSGVVNRFDPVPNWVGTTTWNWAFPTLAPGSYWFFVQPQDTSGRAPYLHNFFTVTSGNGLAASPEGGGTLAGEPIDGQPVDGEPTDSLSPVGLSQGTATRDSDKDGGDVLVTLKFTGPLDAKWAQASPSLWIVNDGAVEPLEVLCTGEMVTLRLPGALLSQGEPLRVWWRGALDASGRILVPGEWAASTP